MKHCIAIGDALGMPVELKSIEDIRSYYRDDSFLKLEENAVLADDTEIMIAVTNFLLLL